MACSLPKVPRRSSPGDFSEKSGYLAGRRLAAQRDRPDAVFAANDVIAVGCLVAFREAGLRVPGGHRRGRLRDIPLASLVSPALTTVRVRIAELGRAALEQLLLSIQSPARTRLVSRRLVARGGGS